MNNMDRKHDGGVTVYLSLVFIVLMTLIVCIISLMRYQAERVNIKRNLDIAVESSFAKYFRPLLDEYGMFYYIESDEEAIVADIMSYFYENQKNVPKILALTPNDIEVSDKAYAPDNGMANVKDQMCDAIIYKYGEDIADAVMEEIRKRLDIMDKDCGELSEISQEVSDIEEDADIEKDVLNLLELIEGVRIEGGTVKCANIYVKQAVVGKATMLNTGIDSGLIWNAVSEKYWSIDDILTKLMKLAEKGAQGSKVIFPDKEIRAWKGKLEDIKHVTQRAYTLAKELDDRMDGDKKSSCICDISRMCGHLSDNMLILDRLIFCAEKAVPESVGQWKEYKAHVKECIDMLSGYHIKSLYFDYSTLSLKKESNPVKDVNPQKMILTGLLAEDTGISSNAVEESDIYLKVNKENGKKKIYDYREPDELGDFLDSCKVEYKSGSISDGILSSLYVNEYLRDFTDGDAGAEDERALMYEKEYVIAANEADMDNLDDVIKRILLMRTGTSFVYLISDRQKSNMAYATAVAIVGFAGMEALVRCTQYMILAGWAYEDACVDVYALLSGKKIPILKNKNSLNVQYSELLMFGKQFIRDKAEKIKVSKGMDYSDILLTYICVLGDKKRTARCMDIIQYNMKLNYSGEFSFINALYSARTLISCSRPYNMQAESEYIYR